jgi:hypothetical protein
MVTEKHLKSFGTWYQPIEIDGIWTIPQKKGYGLDKWEHVIKPSLPFPLKDKIVLDIGTNAGLYAVQAIKEGAKHVYAVEALKPFQKQAEFVINYFGVDDRVTLIKNYAEDVNWRDFNRVDIIFAFNTLYWVGNKRNGQNYWLPDTKKVLGILLRELATLSRYFLITGSPINPEGQFNYCSVPENTRPFLDENYWHKYDIKYLQRTRHYYVTLAQTEIHQIDTMDLYRFLVSAGPQSTPRCPCKKCQERTTTFPELYALLNGNDECYKNWLRVRPWKDTLANIKTRVNNLKISIEREGIKKPIRVYEEYNRFEIDGWNRLTIAEYLGLEKVPVIFKSKNVEAEFWKRTQ